MVYFKSNFVFYNMSDKSTVSRNENINYIINIWFYHNVYIVCIHLDKQFSNRIKIYDWSNFRLTYSVNIFRIYIIYELPYIKCDVGWTEYQSAHMNLNCWTKNLCFGVTAFSLGYFLYYSKRNYRSFRPDLH